MRRIDAPPSAGELTAPKQELLMTTMTWSVFCYPNSMLIKTFLRLYFLLSTQLLCFVQKAINGSGKSATDSKAMLGAILRSLILLPVVSRRVPALISPIHSLPHFH